MKKVLFVLLALLLFAGTTQGQGKGVALSIGPEVAIPMGDFTDVTELGIGFGGTVKIEFGVSNNLVILGTVGYLTFMEGETSLLGATVTTSMTAIPVFAGLKYYFGKTTFYVLGEAGMHFLTIDVEASVPGVSAGTGSESDSEFGFAFGAGYEIKVGKSGAVDLCAKYVVAASDFSFVDIRVGYSFALGK